MSNQIEKTNYRTFRPEDYSSPVKRGSGYKKVKKASCRLTAETISSKKKKFALSKGEKKSFTGSGLRSRKKKHAFKHPFKPDKRLYSTNFEVSETEY